MLTKAIKGTTLVLVAATAGAVACASDEKSDEIDPFALRLRVPYIPAPVGCPPADELRPGELLVENEDGELVPPYLDDQSFENGSTVITSPIVGFGGNTEMSWTVFNDKTAPKPEGGKTLLVRTNADGFFRADPRNLAAAQPEDLCLDQDGNPRNYLFLRNIGDPGDPELGIPPTPPQPETCFGGAMQMFFGGNAPGGFDAFNVRCLPDSEGNRPEDCQETQGITFLARAARRTKVRFDFLTLRTEARARPIQGIDKPYAWCREVPPGTPSCEIGELFENPAERPRIVNFIHKEREDCNVPDPDNADITLTCDPGFYCNVGNKCIPDPCSNPDRIPAGACGQGCSTDADCQSGTHCGESETGQRVCTAECSQQGTECGAGLECSARGRCFFDEQACVKRRLNEFVPDGLFFNVGGVCPRPYSQGFNGTPLPTFDQPLNDLLDVPEGCDDHFNASFTFEPVWTRYRVYWEQLSQRGFGRDVHCYVADSEDGERINCGFDPAELMGLTIGVPPNQPGYEVYLSDLRFF